MSKYLILSMIIMILGCNFSMAWAGIVDERKEALIAANREIGWEYFTDLNNSNRSLKWIFSKKLSNIMIGKSKGFGSLVYGTPHGDIRDGENRYTGYTKKDEYCSNPEFPHDAWQGGYLEDRHWLTLPWRVESQERVKNDFDGEKKYLSNIQMGIALYYPDISRGGNSVYWDNWHNYVNVLMPPTQFTWGMGRMWHQEAGGSKWYITVPLAPGAVTVKPDMSTILEADSFKEVNPGEKITSNVTYRLNSEHNRSEKILLRLDHIVNDQNYTLELEPIYPSDKLDTKGMITFNPGEEKTYRYTCVVQEADTKIISRINPENSVIQDSNWTNNRDEAWIYPQMADISVDINQESDYWVEKGSTIPIDYWLVISRKDDLLGEIPVRVTVFDELGKHENDIFLSQFQTKKFHYNFNGASGKYIVEAQAWPIKGKDKNPKDNINRKTVTVESINFDSDDKIKTGTIDMGT
ncbi:MAG: hypothetical protein HGA27_05555 [Peptococcaceae bacterium]|nr:hypothetical protein [Peptococcaceae bacterium]